MSLWDDLSGAGGIFGGAADIFGGFATASGDTSAANYYNQAAALTALSTGLKQEMVTRQGYQAVGQNKAAVSAGGFSLSGTAEDLVRQTGQQVGLTRGVVGLQGQIQEQAYTAQAASAQAAAQASQGGGILGGLGGLIGGIATIFSDDRLKTDVVYQRTLPSGVNVYHFRLAGLPQIYEGVIVSDVFKKMPEAIYERDDGFYMVDYDKVGAKLMLVGHA